MNQLNDLACCIWFVLEYGWFASGWFTWNVKEKKNKLTLHLLTWISMFEWNKKFVIFLIISKDQNFEYKNSPKKMNQWSVLNGGSWVIYRNMLNNDGALFDHFLWFGRCTGVENTILACWYASRIAPTYIHISFCWYRGRMRMCLRASECVHILKAKPT